MAIRAAALPAHLSIETRGGFYLCQVRVHTLSE